MSSGVRQAVLEIQRAVGVKADGIFGPVTAGAVLARLAGQAPEAPGLDARSERTLATLDPKARQAMRAFLGAAQATAATLGCDYVAISGTRTPAEQDRLYEAWKAGTGGKAARAGYSWHNFGVAMDCGVFRGGRYLDEAEPATAARVHQACAAHAPARGLEWGGNWKGASCDPPHYQVALGSSTPTEAHRRRYQQRGSVL
jgi:peptidoglycan LD-endopeptidase CwlK